MGSVNSEPDNCPLNCSICSKQFIKPIRLKCQHSFCKSCIISNKNCPICLERVDDIDLKEDVVLTYLLESSNEKIEKCGNCDATTYPMYYCKTCKQPLCINCKSSTHKDKIFLNHTIIDLEECGNDKGDTNCIKHDEPYILFCLDQRKLMCAKCFSGSHEENRHNFANIDIARKACWSKLNEKATKLKTFQVGLKEDIELRKTVLMDLDGSFNEVSKKIEKQADEYINKILEVKNELLKNLKKEKQQRENELNSQVKLMINMINPIKLNLLSASIICSTASEIDLLRCFDTLTKSIDIIISQNHERISFSSEIGTDINEEFIKLLEKSFGWTCLIPGKLSPPPILPKSNNHQSIATVYPVVQSTSAFDLVKSRSASPMNSYANYIRTNGSALSDISYYRNFSYKKSQCDLTGIFGESYKKIEGIIREMTIELTTLSNDLIELQKDMTFRKCIIKKDYIELLIQKGENLERKLNDYKLMMEDMQMILLNDWHEQMERIKRQQKMFRDKMKDVQQINEYLLKAKKGTNALKPYAMYLAKLVGVINPKRSEEIELAPMEKILQEICNLEPDSQKRIEAIEKEEEAQRQAREMARIEEKQAAIKAKQNLKTTKDIKRKSSFSSKIVENSRDRNVMGAPVTRLSKRKHRFSTDNICYDDNGSIINNSCRPVSPRELLASPTSESSVKSSPPSSPIDELLNKRLSNNISPLLSNKSEEKKLNNGSSPTIEFTTEKLPQKEGTPPLFTPIPGNSSVVPISVIPPAPPPPPEGFIAPILPLSSEAKISPNSNQHMVKKPMIPSSLSADNPTILAREQVLEQIKERFKKSESEDS